MKISETHESQDISLSVQDRIDQLRSYAEAMQSSPRQTPSDNTVKQYLAAWQRMQKRYVLPEAIGANARRSYNLYRSALVYCLSMRILESWQEINQRDGVLTAVRAHELLDEIESCRIILKRYPTGDRDSASRWRCPERGSVKRGKRRGLSRLPMDWRQIITSAIPTNGEYYNALLISAITGLRPEELLKGVVVDATDWDVRISIRGAKVTKNSGQPLRQLWISKSSSMVGQLLSEMAKTGENRLVVSIGDPRKYCDYVRSLSGRVFPNVKYVVTPYSFRHQFAADQKAVGTSVEALGQMLGHVSGRSQQSYGSTGQGRTPVAPVKSVAASRPINSIKNADKPWMTKVAHQDQVEYIPLPTPV